MKKIIDKFTDLPISNHAKWCLRNPEKAKVMHRNSSNNWRKANPAKVREIKRREYFRHKDSYIKQATEWAKNNPEKRRVIFERDNLKRAGLKKIWHQLKYYENIIEMDECVLCYSTTNLLVHHRDGNNGRLGRSLNNKLDNLVVLCRKCHPKVHHRGIIRIVI